MKYAIISDIHGNIDALSAVLQDAEKMGVDKYLFVGDYCTYFPDPNQVVDKLRNIKNAIVVGGNEDRSLTAYAGQDQSTWTDGQFQARYWCFREVDDATLRYLTKLPKEQKIKEDGIELTITHYSADIYGDIEYRKFSSMEIAERYQKDGSYSRGKLLNGIREYMKTTEFMAAIDALSEGVYIFGHTHMQWYAQIGNKTFINPGSCGLPLDGTPGAPYTLLDIEKCKIHVQERRVSYDHDGLIRKYKSSGLFDAAPVWSKIILHQMTTGFDCALKFLRFADQYAEKANDPIRPFTVETWTEAYDAWCRRR